jgi:chromosome segregation ATPase
MSDDLAQLITEMKESLEREIHAFRDEMRTRFDTQATRLERHAGLLQNGGRSIVRLNEWAEKIDGAIETKDREIVDLRERVEDLRDRLDDLEKRMEKK